MRRRQWSTTTRARALILGVSLFASTQHLPGKNDNPRFLAVCDVPQCLWGGLVRMINNSTKCDKGHSSVRLAEPGRSHPIHCAAPDCDESIKVVSHAALTDDDLRCDTHRNLR